MQHASISVGNSKHKTHIGELKVNKTTYNIEKISGDNYRPSMKHKQGYLIRYRLHPDFGWTGCRTFGSQEEAESFAETLDENGDLPSSST